MTNKLYSKLTRAKHDRVVKNSIYGLIGFVIPFLVMFLLTPALVHQMGTEGYGLWSVAVSALGMMSMLEFGLGLAVSKYIAEYHVVQDKKGIGATVTIGFFLSTGLGVLLFIPLFLFAGMVGELFETATIPEEQVVRVIRMAALGFIPLLLRNSALAIPQGFQRFKIPTIIRTAQTVLVVVVALVLVGLNATIEQVIISTVLLMWVVAFISLIIAYLVLRPLQIAFPYCERKYLSKMLSFMTYSGLRGVGAQLFTSVDRIVVGIVLGLSSVTYYVVCIGIANKFVALANAFTQALVPAASSLYVSGDTRKVWRYFLSSFFILTIFNLSLGVFLILIAEPFLTWWIGPEFARKSLGLFRVLILVYSILALTAPAAQIANGIGAPWINTIGALVGGIGTVVLIIILGQSMGLIGAGWANIASWIKFIAPIYVIKKLYGRRKDILGVGHVA